jgi:hypothetical protein
MPESPKTSKALACAGVAVVLVAAALFSSSAAAPARGGNDVELHLEAAKLTNRAAKEVDFETWSGDGRGGRFGPLLGGGPLLVYNSWALVCEAMSCPPQKLRLVDAALARISAGHKRVVKKGRDSHRLAAVGGGRVAVERAGAVKVLTPTGSVVVTIRAVRGNPPRAIALSRARLVVERMHALEIYDPATGRKAKSISLGPAASLRLVAVNAKLALLRGRHRLVLVRLSDGKRTKLPAPPTRIVGATLTAAGLFYARNTRRTSPRGRVTFEPTAALLARF